MITREELIKKYLTFFEKKGHKIIPSASLVPQNDPTVLFTTAGMHPLVPYLLGAKHPLGKRICDVQKCVRTGDIDEVGDKTHHTFFEMLGNWSLGDYGKKEAIEWSFEFATKELQLPLKKIAVTVFAGDKDAPKDSESAKIWESLGISKKRIAFLGKEDNWWGPAGTTGPCGPDTELFFWTDKTPAPESFDPKDTRWVEIWNDVLMQYVKEKRLILVDGMNCLYDESFKINKELLEIIDGFNTHTILVVNGFKEKGYELVKNNTQLDANWQSFSLEKEEIKKDNRKYFETLLKRFNLRPEEIIYFDHNKNNVETAKSLGIISIEYVNNQSTKKFIENNIHAFIPAKQKNIDNGRGLERILAVLNGFDDSYKTEIWSGIIKKIEAISKRKYGESEEITRSIRIVSDHIRAAIFIIGDGVVPGNTAQGYVLRRLIRRAIRYGKIIGLKEFTKELVDPVIKVYAKTYPELETQKEHIKKILKEEEQKFNETLEKGVVIIEKNLKSKKPINKDAFENLMANPNKRILIGELLRKRRENKEYDLKSPKLTKNEINQAVIEGSEAFLLYQSYGFPLELIDEIAIAKRLFVDHYSFREELKKHQESSRTGSEGMFKSGLADHSEQTTRLHTATHLLNEALRHIVDSTIKQRGSNITAERLRFDFSCNRKVTPEELKKVEDWVNDKIKRALPVERKEMKKSEAEKLGAQMEFGTKYPEVVSVYSIIDPKTKEVISREFCTGPHVKNTSELKHFKIIKEEASSAGVRRIKAVVE